jgi:YD repeat-containing protein
VWEGWAKTARCDPTSRHSYSITGEVDALGYRTSFNYDCIGLVSARIDRKGNIVTFNQDRLGRTNIVRNELSYRTPPHSMLTAVPSMFAIR